MLLDSVRIKWSLTERTFGQRHVLIFSFLKVFWDGTIRVRTSLVAWSLGHFSSEASGFFYALIRLFLRWCLVYTLGSLWLSSLGRLIWALTKSIGRLSESFLRRFLFLISLTGAFWIVCSICCVYSVSLLLRIGFIRRLCLVNLFPGKIGFESFSIIVVHWRLVLPRRGFVLASKSICSHPLGFFLL